MRSSLLVAAVLALGACNFTNDAQADEGASGPSMERRFDVSSFDAVTTLGAYDVEVAVGPAASVRAVGPADVLDKMDVKVEGGNLVIGRKRSEKWVTSTGGKAKIYVTVPTLRAASTNGTGNLVIDKVSGEGFKGSIAGAGDVRIADVQVHQLDFDVAGTGDIVAAGKADRSSVSIAGTGDVDLSKVNTADAIVSIAGAGDVSLHATGTVQVELVGAGDVTVTGGARCSVDKLGPGEVKCGA